MRIAITDLKQSSKTFAPVYEVVETATNTVLVSFSREAILDAAEFFGSDVSNEIINTICKSITEQIGQMTAEETQLVRDYLSPNRITA